MPERIGYMIKRNKDFTLEEIFLEELDSKKIPHPSFFKYHFSKMFAKELMLLVTVKVNICIL